MRHDASQETLDINKSLPVSRIETEPYFKVYLVGHPYPMKGLATVADINAINKVKDVAKETLKSIWRDNALSRFTEGAYPLLPIRNPSRFTPAARELQKGIPGHLGYIIACIAEYDAAYRFRIQDLFSETDVPRLRSRPRREIFRLMMISWRRDIPAVRWKILLVLSWLPIFLCKKTYKIQWRSFLASVDYKNLCLDEGDRYWLAQRKDYHYNA